MKKTLVGVDNLAEFICREKAEIRVAPGMILTPGAKDELSRRGIAVVYGACPGAGACPAHGADGEAFGPAASGLFGAAKDSGTGQSLGQNSGLERVLLGVAAMLRDEYGVTDPEELRALSLRAAKIIRENL